MASRRLKGLIISDFNAENLAGYLNHSDTVPEVDMAVAPFGQVMQTLMNDSLECWRTKPDFAVIWTQPQSVIESFNRVLRYEDVAVSDLLGEVGEYCSTLLGIRDRVHSAFVPTWVLPSYHRGFGMLDMKNRVGISNLLMRMNLALVDHLEAASNLYVLNTQTWVADKNAFNPKLWYMGKIAFGTDVFKGAARDIKSALGGIGGNARKIIILDLDDTLWGGIVGDIGWENITLGGHDPIGEAYLDFQKNLKALVNRGIVLGIVSKNEKATALQAIDSHPEMVLRADDFAGWRIDWGDKAQNIIDLLSELNLGLQSAVFIDDNPVERARIGDALPEVLVPEWPEDKTAYSKALLSLTCFDTPSISKEDRGRSKMYVSERQRSSLKTTVGSLDEWLKSLGTTVKVEELDGGNLERTSQLLNKTNQMNLSTRRMTDAELLAWEKHDTHKLWTFRVSDKFGDSGLTGIVSVETDGPTGTIVDFVLSCRVMGRKIEETMLSTVIKYARSVGLKEVQAKYIETPKNNPCKEFWKKSGFRPGPSEGEYSWEIDRDYPLPEQIQVG